MGQNENKVPATILALLGGLLIGYALMSVGVNAPTDCGDINQPSNRSLFAFIPAIICAFMALRLWAQSSYIFLVTVSVSIFGFIYMQIGNWDAYAGTVAGCAF